MSLIDPGKKAPAFTLKDQHGKAHRLSDYAGKPVILYFYPKDDTPGCTQETCDFEARLPVAEKYGVWQEKSRYGRTYMGIVRTTYLIGPDGKIEQRWDNVKVDGHAEAVAKAID